MVGGNERSVGQRDRTEKGWGKERREERMVEYQTSTDERKVKNTYDIGKRGHDGHNQTPINFLFCESRCAEQTREAQIATSGHHAITGTHTIAEVSFARLFVGVRI